MTVISIANYIVLPSTDQRNYVGNVKRLNLQVQIVCWEAGIYVRSHEEKLEAESLMAYYYHLFRMARAGVFFS